MITTISATRTLPERILLAASDLETEGRPTFTLADLAAAAWSRDRDTFGLIGGGIAFPDSNKVATVIMGKRGLVALGWLTKTGRNYALTTPGRAMAKTLSGEESDRKTCGAVRNYRTGIVPTWEDACEFWGIDGKTSEPTLSAMLERTAKDVVGSKELKAVHDHLLRTFRKHLDLLRSRAS